MLALGQLQRIQEKQLITHRFLCELCNIDATDCHGKARLLQTVAVTIRAGYAVHKACNLFFHPVAGGFAKTALQVAHQALKAGIISAFASFRFPVEFQLFAASTVEQGLKALCGNLFNGRVECKVIPLRKRLVIHFADGARRIIPATCLNATLFDGKFFVRQQ